MLGSLLPLNLGDKNPWQHRELLQTHLGKNWLPSISSALNFAVVALNSVSFCQAQFLPFLLRSRSCSKRALRQIPGVLLHS